MDLLSRWPRANWRSAGNVARPFVRHPHSENSPGVIWHEGLETSNVRLTIAIPTMDANRYGYFFKLLEQVSRQTLTDCEVIVVRGDPRHGRAINVAAALARGRYFLTLDDDTSLPDPEALRRLADVLDANPEVGLAGGNNVVPPQASIFVQRAMQQIPRRSWTPVAQVTDSDLAEHPCLMMRTEEFKAVGGENELLPRGLDPYLRQVFREFGKRVVVVPGVIYSHLPPGNWTALLRQFVRNGRQAAFVNCYYPQWVIETPDAHGEFMLRLPFRRRASRYLTVLSRSLWSGQWIWLSCQVAYVAGFMAGWIVEQIRKHCRALPTPGAPDQANPGGERPNR